jgi:hypothetical protein
MKESINNNKLRFWVPMEISKAKDAEGNEEMKIKGIASTIDKDADDENLDPNGFDLSLFKSQGYLNWHHKSSTDPSMIVGEPTKANITKKGLEIEGMLYGDSPIAKSIYKLAQTLEKNSKTRRLGFSIEGKALERDPLNPKKVTKALITGCAITFLPKNPNTIMNIVKGDYEDLYQSESDDEIDFAYFKQTNQLSKSEMFEKIFERYPDLPNEDAENLLTSILNNMTIKKKKGTASATEAEFQKSLDVLGLNDGFSKGDESEELEDDEEFEDDEIIDDEEEIEDEEEIIEDEDEEDEDDEDLEKSFQIEQERLYKQSISKKRNEVSTNDIIKAIEFQSLEATNMFKAIGTMINQSHTKIKNLEDRLEKALDTIDDLQSEPLKRKSVQSFRDKNFEKGIKDDDDDTIQKGGTKNDKAISFSRERKAVLNLLEQATFEKGYDPEFGVAMTEIEAGGVPNSKVIARIESQYGVKITA